MGVSISTLPSLDTLENTDFLLVARPGVGDFKASPSQIGSGQSTSSVVSKFISVNPAVRAASTTTGAPNTQYKKSVGNVTPTGELHVISKGMSMISSPIWNSNGTNLLVFGDILCTKTGKLITSYARYTSEVSNDGKSSIVAKSSTDGGSTWSNETVIALASTYNVSTGVLGAGGIWQNSLGRIFQTFSSENSSGALWTMWMVASDDDGVTWTALGSSPIAIVDPNTSYTSYYFSIGKGVEIADGLGPLGSGTLLITGFGQNLSGGNGNDTTILKSVDNGATWTHQGTVAAAAGTGGVRYIENTLIYLGGNTVMNVMLHDNTSQIAISTSTNKGVSWGSITDVFAANAKPAAIILPDGQTIVVMTRGPESTFPSIIRTSRNLGLNWEAELQFDQRTFYQADSIAHPPLPLYNYYGGLTQVAPGVIACAYGVSETHSTQADWVLTYFLDGKAASPLGSIFAKDISSARIGFNKQIVQDPALPITYSTTNTTVLMNTVNSIIDMLVHSGVGLVSPANLPNVLYWGEPWQISSGINSLTNTFTSSDSTSVITAMTRSNGDSIAANQLSGTWGISANRGYCSAGGTQEVCVWDAGFGDLVIEWQGIQPSSGAVQAALRVSSATTFLWLFADTSGSLMRLYKVVSGTATALTTWAITAPTTGNTIAYKVTLIGSVIIVAYCANVSGTPVYTTLGSFTLLSTDITTFANTNTKFGMVGNSSAQAFYTSLKFETQISSGDTIGQLADLSGAGVVGDLLQNTTSHKPMYYQTSWLFNGKPFLLVNNATQFLQSQTFSAKSSPNTYVIVCALPQTTTGSRGLFSSPHDSLGLSGSLSSSTDNLAASNNSLVISAPAFGSYQNPYYPQGPMILILESNGANSNLWRDGKLIATGTMGVLTTTQLTLGDASNLNYLLVAHFSYYNGLLTQTLKNEIFRYNSVTFGVDAWNPY